MSTKEKVYATLRPRRWVSSSELNSISPSATRRARELRDDFEIKTRRVDGEYQYRLVGPR